MITMWHLSYPFCGNIDSFRGKRSLRVCPRPRSPKSWRSTRKSTMWKSSRMKSKILALTTSSFLRPWRVWSSLGRPFHSKSLGKGVKLGMSAETKNSMKSTKTVFRWDLLPSSRKLKLWPISTTKCRNQVWTSLSKFTRSNLWCPNNRIARLKALWMKLTSRRNSSKWKWSGKSNKRNMKELPRSWKLTRTSNRETRIFLTWPQQLSQKSSPWGQSSNSEAKSKTKETMIFYIILYPILNLFVL